ncbi:MAG: radical SAM protein [Planctomycetota bacterium]|nr:radical SAM protein [Planctomycetota bacterium]MDA1106143.1 radical SAM protein [Planctomycetota bacterium]
MEVRVLSTAFPVSPEPSAAAASSRESLRINEVFHSIQGESTRAGEPCVFVRLAGCPLRCTYCDTSYAFRQGTRFAIDDVVAAVLGVGCPLVELTGGEPFAQAGVFDLAHRLCDLGLTVMAETSGAIALAAVDPRVELIVDVKTPSSGESHRMVWENLDQLDANDEVKFVVGNRADYEFAKEVIAKHMLVGRVRAILMSPVFEQPGDSEIAGHAGLPARDLAEWMLADRLQARLQLQLHKFIWEPRTRGV